MPHELDSYQVRGRLLGTVFIGKLVIGPPLHKEILLIPWSSISEGGGGSPLGSTLNSCYGDESSSLEEVPLGARR